MARYEVYYTDPTTGATSPIDTWEDAPDHCTGADYVSACEQNADQEWLDMLHAGEVTLYRLDDEAD